MENKLQNSYYAFISYSRKDIKDAKWIHSSLEKFHIPAKLSRPADAEPIPKLLRCFRDINDLDVMPESFVKGIENALASSNYLVVVASPNSAQSTADGNHYVDWEIQKFIELHGLEYAKSHILPVIIAGEISQNTKETECLPPSLYKLGDDFLTHNFPILDYGDENVLTKDAKNDFILKILAFLLQVKYSVLNDRYQKAQRKRRNFILGTAISLVAFFAVISVYAALGWRSANKNLAFSHYTQANNLLENGETSYALAYYKRSLQLDENPVVRDKVYNLITNGSWLVEKDSVTEMPKDKIDYLEKKEIADKLNVTDWYGFKKTSDRKNGLLETISDDGKFAVVFKDDETFQIIDVESKKVLFQDSPKNGYVWKTGNSIVSSLDCQFFTNNALFAYKQVLASEDNEAGFIIKILNLTDMSVSVVKENGMLSRWTISSDGQFLVYSSRISNSSSELTVYDIPEQKNMWTRREEYPRSEIVFSPDNVHFATTGSILFNDSSSKSVCINNAFHETEQVIMNVNGVVENLQFSNDGRKIAVATNRNSLYLFAVRDGSEIVNNRLFDERIYSTKFTSDDNNIQVKFENSGTKEFAIKANKISFDMLKSPLYSGVILDSILLKNSYICNVVGNATEGRFLEARNIHDKKDYFITPFNDDVKSSGSGVWKIKKSPSEKFIFVYDSVHKQNCVEIYSVNFADKKYLSYQKRINLPCFVEDISVISDKYAVVICDKQQTDNLYFVDFSGAEATIKLLPLSNCLSFGLMGNNLYAVCAISDKENGLKNYALKKLDFKTLSEKWAVPLEKVVVYPNQCKNLCIDKNENVYVVSNLKELSVFTKSGKLLKQIQTLVNISYLALSNDSSYLAIGTDSTSVWGTGHINEVEVWRLKGNALIFKTKYDADKPVSISKIAFSGDASLIHFSGEYQTGGGFYDVWDISSSTKFESSFEIEMPNVFGFDNIHTGEKLLYTSKGTIIRYFFDDSKETMSELKKNDVYQLIGGWTLNKDDVPQMTKNSSKSNGIISSWLTADSKENRTVHPKSEMLLKEILDMLNSKANRNTILDIQSDNSLALDSYCFDALSSVAEKNYKKRFHINSWNDELRRDNEWDVQESNNFWQIALKDEEAMKLYKFHIDNYVQKVPNSAKALYRLQGYYLRTGDEKTAAEIYKKMLREYPEGTFVRLLELNDSELSLEKKKGIFEIMLKDGKAYSFSELKDMFDWYKDYLAMDSSFEEIKDVVDWFIKSFKTLLVEDFVGNYADKFNGIFTDICLMTQYHDKGFDYWLDCVDFLYEGLSDSDKILLRLEEQKQIVSIMNAVAKKENCSMAESMRNIDFASADMDFVSKNLSLLGNLYMYYSMKKYPEKNALLDLLLKIDSLLSYEAYSSAILTDIRIYKKLGNPSVCSKEDIQKASAAALNLMLARLQNGQTAGIKFKSIVSGGQAERIGLNKGDTLLFYDNYPLSDSTKDFFIYDLHTSERFGDKSQVEITIMRDGKILRILAKEGLLGIQF